MVWWRLMTSFLRPTKTRLTAVAAFAALVGIAVPSAGATPATDDQGFADSTSRCITPDTAAAFGSTASSRVAICESPSGQYEYRGVRLRDGAKLIIPATRSGSGAFVAENDGITYTLTPSSLVVSASSGTIREEPMIEFRGTETSTTAPTRSIPSAAPETSTPTTPLPPPLPAEVGHG